MPLREGELVCFVCVAWAAPKKYYYAIFDLELRWSFLFKIIKAEIYLARL